MAKAYTEEMETMLREKFDAENAAESMKELSEMLGKTIPSIRQKLVRMGMYSRKEYVSKTGEKPEKKAEIVGDIADILGVPVEAAESLEKANKSILLKIRTKLQSDK